MLGIQAGRAVVFVLTAWAGLLVTAALAAILPAPRVYFPLSAPNLALLAVLYLGLSLRDPLSTLAACAAATGYLADLVTGAPKGVHIVAFLLLAFAAHAWARLLRPSALIRALFAFVHTTGFGLLVLALREVALHEGSLAPGFSSLRRVPCEALATALVSPLAFRLLARVDRVTTPGARLPQATTR